jgi:hypothetical protein
MKIVYILLYDNIAQPLRHSLVFHINNHHIFYIFLLFRMDLIVPKFKKKEVIYVYKEMCIHIDVYTYRCVNIYFYISVYIYMYMYAYLTV